MISVTSALLLLALLGADGTPMSMPMPMTPAAATEPPSASAPPRPWSLARMMESPLGAPREREGSGTSWQPDLTPMDAVHLMSHGWMFMLHWSVFAGFDDQLGPRGSNRLQSENWLMAMADHSLWGGRISLRTMLTAEPGTMGGPGAPLLLQTGETYAGVPLHDLQHPHDLFMEVAALYSRAITRELGFELYLAPAGEPALGPVAFMHRASARFDPLPPLGHHWQDSTHVSFGVVTAGLVTRWVKLEASVFNGREPDEVRWNFDFAPLDSWSVRVSAVPVPWLALQASYGALHAPERLFPLEDLQRLTASAMVHLRVGERGLWATTAIFGRNIPSEEPSANALLLESSLDFNGHDAVFGRVEWVQKLGHDLVLSFDPQLDEVRIPVASLVLGYVHDFDPLGPVVFGLGARVAVNLVPDTLGPYYGSTAPVGAMVYLHFRPAGLDPERLARLEQAAAH